MKYRKSQYHVEHSRQAMRKRRPVYIMVVVNGMTLEKTGAIIGKSRERVRQICMNYAIRSLGLRDEIAAIQARRESPLRYLRHMEQEQRL